MAAATGLFGPHPLTQQGIDSAVDARLGAYALGSVADGTFYVNYVGRSDADLNARLKNWTGKKYTHFKYGHYENARDAFLKECSMFHDFGGTAKLDNSIHPDRPNGSNWKCPNCNVFS